MNQGMWGIMEQNNGHAYEFYQMPYRDNPFETTRE